MEIESIKTWQWMLAGLVVGFAFSVIVAWTGPTFDTQARDTIEQGEFENDAIALTKFGNVSNLVEQWHKGQPMLRDVTVHPPLASDPKHFWVTGRAYFIGLKPTDPTKANGQDKVYEEWRPFKYCANIPYEPGYTIREEKKLDKIYIRNPNQAQARNRQLEDLKKALGGQSSFNSVIDYLKAVSTVPDANFKFQYAWWELTGPKWTMPPIAGFLLIGVAWPLSLGVLRNLGLTKPPPVKAPAKKAAPLPQRQPVRTAPAIAAAAPVKPAPALDTRKYGGEFYPVVKSTTKE